VARGSHLKKPLGAFLLEAHEVAAMVERDAERLSLLTQGKITAQTAVEIRELAERLARIGPRTVQPRPQRAAQLVKEARRIVADVRRAAQVLGDQAIDALPAGRQRSLMALRHMLDVCGLIVTQRHEDYALLLGTDVSGAVARCIAAIRGFGAATRTQRAASDSLTAARNEALAMLVVRVQAAHAATTISISRAAEGGDAQKRCS
jgi:hypothetical protein